MMQLVDWRNVARNGLWLIGLAWALGAISMASYVAQERNLRLLQVLNTPRCRLVLSLSTALCSLGLLWTALSWWTRLLWALLAVLSLAQSIRSRWRDHDQ